MECFFGGIRRENLRLLGRADVRQKFEACVKFWNHLWTGSSMVEQLTLNQRVGGSSPPRFTSLP